MSIQPFPITHATCLERLDQMASQGGGLHVDSGLEAIDAEGWSVLAHEVGPHLVARFAAMVAGEEVNTTQQRPALHTALRAPANKRTGTARVVGAAHDQELERLHQWLENSCHCTTLLVIGIGGSHLGPQSAVEALRPWHRAGKAVHFLSNADLDACVGFRTLDWDHTLVAVISKSGGTYETHFLMQEMQKYATTQTQWVAITQENSQLDQHPQFVARFYLDPSIGGRYSVSSVVGALPVLFLCDRSVWKQFAAGAHAMDQAACATEIAKNPALALALGGIWSREQLGASSCAVIPYASCLRSFIAHLQQCDMESNGKGECLDGTPAPYAGPVLWGDVGANAQHSFFQWLHQGPREARIEMIGFCHPQHAQVHNPLYDALFAQSAALAIGDPAPFPKNFPGGRSVAVVTAKQLTPTTFGALLALYEAKIVLQGFYWGINSFDQEGVELGKRLIRGLMEGQPLGAYSWIETWKKQRQFGTTS